jgi:hypothetical protein
MDLNISLKSKMAAMAAMLDFCKNFKIQNIALVGMKDPTKFHFDGSKGSKVTSI